MYLTPEWGQKGYRREMRQGVRNALGTSSDPVPSLGRVLRAARKLSRLLSLTTNGKYKLTITTGDERPVSNEEMERALESWEEV